MSAVRADVSVLAQLPDTLWFETRAGDVTIAVTTVRVTPRLTVWAGPVLHRGRPSPIEESSITTEPGYRPAGVPEVAWLYAARLRALVIEYGDGLTAAATRETPRP